MGRAGGVGAAGEGRALALKQALIGAGFAVFRASRLHNAVAPATRGRGVILTLHRVQPYREATPGYAPNRLLEVAPEFLDRALGLLKAQGFEIVTLAQAVARLDSAGGAPFAALTFDDGYRDVRDFALPILERHGAPFTMFFATGMIERSARLWWLELEEAVRRLDRIEVEQGEIRFSLPSRTAAEKSVAYDRLYWSLRARPEAELLEVVGRLAASVGVTSAALSDALFMNWREAKDFARHPLVGVGAHTCTHRRLAQWPIEVAHEELAVSKARLEAEFGRPSTRSPIPSAIPPALAHASSRWPAKLVSASR